MVDRHGHNWVLLGRFVLVGATGVVVNLVTDLADALLDPRIRYS